MCLRLLVLVLALLLPVAPSAEAARPQVAGLQVALRAHGLYVGPIDAIAGPGTIAAVRAFQQRVGLPVDGVAGRRTRAALGRLGRPLFGRRLLTLGAVGWDVSVLEFLLTRQGFSPGALDGRLTRRTERALARFQVSRNLVPDGIAGRITFAALLGRRQVSRTSAPIVRHVVRPGESLSSIATRYGTTIQRLARSNHLDAQAVLPAGRTLRVPRSSRALARRLSASHAQVRATINFWASRYGVDPRLARALGWMESGYQPHLTSPAGAWGVMQILPSTWEFVQGVLLGHRIPRTMAGNVRVGVLYLRHLLGEFRGSERLALAAWYQGARAVRRHGVYPVSRSFVADVLALRGRV